MRIRPRVEPISGCTRKHCFVCGAHTKFDVCISCADTCRNLGIKPVESRAWQRKSPEGLLHLAGYWKMQGESEEDIVRGIKKARKELRILVEGID